jgi:hypothetical protein
MMKARKGHTMCDEKAEKLEAFLKEAVVVGSYFSRKIKDKSISTHIDKSMAEKYISALDDFLKEQANEGN